jgi:hypothetical protein
MEVFVRSAEERRFRMRILRGTARRIVLGLALAAVFAVVPVRPAAAAPADAAVRAADLWQVALDWLSGLWSPAAPEADSPAGGGTEAAEVCRDAGPCVDPNG